MQKILVIQTAFIGDVVLATVMVEKIHQFLPDAQIHFMVRKGNESLLKNNPYIHEVLIWNKKENKLKNLYKLLAKIRVAKYDKVITLQRFAATGILTGFSQAKERIGFDKNPFSFLFTKKIKHELRPGLHEVDRNLSLIKHFTDDKRIQPKLYPSAEDFAKVQSYKSNSYITITPSSVWFTKQYPIPKWIDLIEAIPSTYNIYLLGGKDNIDDCKQIINRAKNKHITVLAGELSFLQSAALMKDAAMNYVNDSAPLHFASAVNAPVTAIFCSTIPEFGFTPLSDNSTIIQTKEHLPCKPCGLHGRRECPLGHFKCAYTIETQQLLSSLPLIKNTA